MIDPILEERGQVALEVQEKNKIAHAALDAIDRHLATHCMACLSTDTEDWYKIIHALLDFVIAIEVYHLNGEIREKNESKNPTIEFPKSI